MLRDALGKMADTWGMYTQPSVWESNTLASRVYTVLYRTTVTYMRRNEPCHISDTQYSMPQKGMEPSYSLTT